MRGGRALALLLSAVGALWSPAAAVGDFGFRPGGEGLAVSVRKADGSAQRRAGAHPHRIEATIGLNTAEGSSDGDLRDLSLSLPPSFLVNPTTVSECPAAKFQTPRVSPYEESASGESCPNSSQVGVLRVDVGGTARHFGLFNLVPPFGSPVAIGASPFGVPLVFTARLRESDVGFDLVLEDLPQSFDLQEMQLTIWGTPWEGTGPAETGDPIPPTGHNPQRGNCLNEQTGGSNGNCLAFDAAAAPESLIKSFLTLPTAPCGTALAYSVAASSWQSDDDTATATTPALEKCNKPLSDPDMKLMTARAASRTGMVFTLEVNDGGGITNPGGIARPPIKQTVLSLPEGLTINPSVGAGLGTCSVAEFARETATSTPGAGCPNASKIGDVTLEGTLGLTEPLQGSLYVATPYENPFGSLVALYMLARSPRRGLIVKSMGELEPNPATGRLVATFDELPRLLYKKFTLTLREGQRSTLISPPSCGAYTTGLDLASWAAPTVFEHESSFFTINAGEDGGACPAGGLPFQPGLLAGSINAQAGAYTPFYLRMTRTDREQEITSYSASLPPGLLAKIAGVAECPEAAIAAARARTGPRGGAEELAGPSCPESSRIGRTLAGYGVGGTLAYAPGGLYLAGPYNGAPLSVVAIDSALVGPFDLGVIVVRAAIRIDPITAQASIDAAGSDPIPHVLAGIPLHLRDIRVYVERPGFTLNPTSCDPMQVLSHLGGAGSNPFSAADDGIATAIQRFQVLNCSALGFRPKLRFRLSGRTRRSGYPALTASYVPRAGDANLRAVTAILPPAVFLAQEHTRNVCTRVQFRRDACPADSVYGQAQAVTPLLSEPLSGPVYLRSSSHALPDLVADLRGHGIRIEVAGRIDSVRGGLRARFEGLPDAPVTKFTMALYGGRRSLLSLAADPCRRTLRAEARFIAHSNKTEVLRPALRAKCKGSGRKKGARR